MQKFSRMFFNSRAVFWAAILALAGAQGVSGQPMQYASNEGVILAVPLTYGFQVPGGDLSDRFGVNFNTSSGLQLFFKSNWMLELEGQFLFGQKVRTDVIAGLRSPEGYIFSDDGGPADVKLRERGFWAGASIGKLFSLVPDNPRSGLRVSFGAGMLQHKIRIQDDPQAYVPALRPDYKKGYDRLSNGLALKEFIGYQHFSLHRRVNFYAGFEFMQGFTQSRRDWNTDQMTTENDPRFDLLFGIRLGWVLPFYLGSGDEAIYY